MKTTIMKGNHELVHLSPALSRSGGKRAQLGAQARTPRNRLRQNDGHRQCDPAGVVGVRQNNAECCPPPPSHPRAGQKLKGRMEPRTIEFIAGACGGELVFTPGDVFITRVCTDSRQIQAGDLFIALKGDKFDGHDFLSDVVAKGARGIVAEKGRVPGNVKNCAIIAVPDTRKALGHLAARYRADFSLPFVAVAGSNGKTTTKELTASVLSQKFLTLDRKSVV